MLLYAVVAISGAPVLVIEILGTRILGPFYGVSLYLWSALIAVTLAALSLGYAIGGRWADRRPDTRVLAGIIAAAGLWILAVPWLRDPLLHLTESWGLRTAVLVSAAALFAPPLTLLGMVGPFAIRLCTSDVARAGRTAGDLFAISTVASVAGALATGFWLIPAIGVTRLTLGVGAVLLIASAIAARARPATAPSLMAWAPLLLAAGAGWLATTAEARAGSAGLVHVEDSAYAELRVLERDGRRSMIIDGGIHTQVDSLSRMPWLAYVVVAELGADLLPRDSRLLLVGLGGGSTSIQFARRGWQVDAVEIDPAVTRIAQKYFGLEERHAKVHHADGRRFIARSEERWDAIFFDAFGSAAIPFHLVTREAFATARSHLKPGGVLMLNVESVGWKSPLIRSVAATLRSEFRYVTVLPISEPPDQIGNLILIGRDEPIDITYEQLGDPVAALGDDYEHWRVVHRNHSWDNRFEPDSGWGPVLTDDLSPVDLWAEEVNRVARRDLHRMFAAGGSW